MNDWTRIAPLLVSLTLAGCGGNGSQPPTDSGTPDAATPDGATPDASGPDGGACMDQTFVVTNSGTTSWSIDGVSGNPPLTLCRGFTYTFQISATGHPFAIHQDSGNTMVTDRYTQASGLTGQGTQNGDLVFTPDASAPNTLYYQCEVHSAMTGMLTIVNP